MVVDDDYVVLEGCLLCECACDGVGDCFCSVLNGDYYGGFYGEVVWAVYIGLFYFVWLQVGSYCFQVVCTGLFHLYLYVSVAWIDVVETLFFVLCLCFGGGLGV